MEIDLVKKIAEKASALPLDAQQKALAYVESLGRAESSEKKPFRSVKGVLTGDLSNLDADIAEMRREVWRNFPREEPK